MVRLGISVPRSYVCWCCLEAKGLGMNHGTTTYCMRCWEPRSRELPCQHELPAQPARQIAV